MEKVTSEQVEEVFNYWVTVLKSAARVQPKLGDKRRRKIVQAIKDYGVDVCKDAIDGCRASSWHMGQNPRGKRYDDIELILRDEAHIERFAEIKYGTQTNEFDLTEEPF